jgi:hypothetical protein
MKGRSTNNSKKVDTKQIAEDFKKFEDKATKLIKTGKLILKDI